MIAFIKGEIADMTEGSLILDVNGIGYEVLVPGQTISMVEGIGQAVKLHTYLQVREDAVTLFGFLSKDDLQMFRMLTGVSGVGPRAPGFRPPPSPGPPVPKKASSQTPPPDPAGPSAPE